MRIHQIIKLSTSFHGITKKEQRGLHNLQNSKTPS